MKTVSKKYLYAGVMFTFLIILFTCTTFYEQDKKENVKASYDDSVSLDEQIEKISYLSIDTKDDSNNQNFSNNMTQRIITDDDISNEDITSEDDDSLEEFYKNYTLYREKHTLPLLEEQEVLNERFDDYDADNEYEQSSEKKIVKRNEKKESYSRQSIREQEFSKALSAKSAVSLNTNSGSILSKANDGLLKDVKDNINTAAKSPIFEKYSEFANSDYVLKNSVEPLKSPYALLQGSVIRARLLSGIRSELPGQISAVVVSNVYDSVKGNYLLIPRGTRIIGMYSSDIKINANRVFAGFSRLIFPNGSSINLGAMPGQSLDGYAGFDADVQTHFFKNLMSSFLISTIQSTQEICSDEYIYSKDHTSYAKRSAKNFLENTADASNRTLSNSINLSPTLNVEPGYMFSIGITKDIYFNGPYKG